MATPTATFPSAAPMPAPMATPIGKVKPIYVFAALPDFARSSDSDIIQTYRAVQPPSTTNMLPVV